jgi:hypothetical protein
MRVNGDRRKRHLPPDEDIEKRDPVRLSPSAENNDGDLVGEVFTGVIPCETVDAVCLSMRLETYNRYNGKRRWVLEFSVAIPEEYSGMILKLYLQDYNGKLPVTSQLYQAASIASRGLRPRQRITKADFVHRLFRCHIRPCVPTDGKQPYSVIDHLIEKLTS